jgi:cyclic beta-1,2-glucan synthetase
VPSTAGQVALTITFLADQALLLLHAIAITLYRLFVSHRHLLEWETAAAAEQRLGGGVRDFVHTMWPAMVLALAAAGVVAAVNPLALPAKRRKKRKKGDK